MKRLIRWAFFFIGMLIFSLGITMTINVQHLGIHPWDVLNVALYHTFGMTIGSWNIIVSITLVLISMMIDRRYIKFGTLINAVFIGLFVDIFMWLDFLPHATYSLLDVGIMLLGIAVMGVGGGMYNAGGVGSGPRDGFMLSLSDKTGLSIQKVRIIVETSVLVIGFIIGGPVFLFSLIFTFIQSPIFQYSYQLFGKWLVRLDEKLEARKRLIAKQKSC